MRAIVETVFAWGVIVLAGAVHLAVILWKAGVL